MTDRQTDRLTDRQARQTDRKTDIQTDRLTDRLTYKQTGSMTYRQTDRQANIHGKLPYFLSSAIVCIIVFITHISPPAVGKVTFKKSVHCTRYK